MAALTPSSAQVSAISPQRSISTTKVSVPGRIVSGPPAVLHRASRGSFDGSNIPTALEICPHPTSCGGIVDTVEPCASGLMDSSSALPTVGPRDAAETCATNQKKHSTSADDAKMKVHNMHQEMLAVENTIAALQRDNEWLKCRYSHNRQSLLAKYFVLQSGMFMLQFFGEWKRVAEAGRWERAAQATEEMRAKDHQQFDAHSIHLDSVAFAAQESQRQTEREMEELRARLEQAEATIRACSEQISQYQVPPAQTSPMRSNADATEYMKVKLHELLSAVDPRYMPPLHGPSVKEVIQQQREAHKRGNAMLLPAPRLVTERMVRPPFIVRNYGSAPAEIVADEQVAQK